MLKTRAAKAALNGNGVDFRITLLILTKWLLYRFQLNEGKLATTLSLPHRESPLKCIHHWHSGPVRAIIPPFVSTQLNDSNTEVERQR